MSSRNDLCQEIASQLRDLKRDWRALTNEFERVKYKEQELSVRFAELQAKRERFIALGVSVPARVAVGGPIGAATSVLGAIANANELARLDSQLAMLKPQLQNLRNRLQELERKRTSKMDLIRQYQANFNKYDCFELGFSHELLNMR